MANWRKRKQHAAAIGIGVGMAAVLLAAAPVEAANPVCVGQLGKAAQGGMADVTEDWRNDFLGAGQPAGHYAVHIAHLRTPDCPPLP